MWFFSLNKDSADIFSNYILMQPYGIMGVARMLVIFQENRINLPKKSAWVKLFSPSQLWNMQQLQQYLMLKITRRIS